MKLHNYLLQFLLPRSPALDVCPAVIPSRGTEPTPLGLNLTQMRTTVLSKQRNKFRQRWE